MRLRRRRKNPWLKDHAHRLTTDAAAVDVPEVMYTDENDDEYFWYTGYRVALGRPDARGASELVVFPSRWWDDEFGDPVWQHWEATKARPLVRATYDARTGAIVPDKGFSRALAKYDVFELRAAAARALMSIGWVR